MQHKTPIQIRFKDIDAIGHVNNVNHLTYFELARINYFGDTVGRELNWENDGMMVVRATIDYKQPVYFRDKVYVLTEFLKMGTTSFELGYQLIREEKDGSETILATGTSVIVCISYKDKRPIPVPKELIEKMKRD